MTVKLYVVLLRLLTATVDGPAPGVGALSSALRRLTTSEKF